MNDRKFKTLGMVLIITLPVAYFLSLALRGALSSTVFNLIYFIDLALGLVLILPYAIKRVKRMSLTEWLIVVALVIYYGILVYKTTIF